MVVGETGTGKSTFLRTLFRRYLNDDEIIRAGLNKKPSKTVQIEEIGRFSLPADSLDCNVHLYDSRGYGDYMNNANAIGTVRSYLEEAHNNWLELNGNMMTEADRNAADGRIHCLFYFIAPHRFKDIDGEFIKQLWDLAPIVPVIAKADTMTLDERREHLLNVHQCLKQLQQDSGSDRSINFIFEEEIDESFINPDSPSSLEASQSATANTANPTNSSIEHEVTLSTTNIKDNDHSNNNDNKTNDNTELLQSQSLNLKSGGNEQSMSCGFDHISTSLLQSTISVTAESNDPSAQGVVHSHMYESMTVNATIVPMLPKIRSIFAVVCDGSSSGMRIYPWGSLNINDEQHSDFRRLQRLVFEDCHIVSLREASQKLSMGILDVNKNKFHASNKRFQTIIEITKLVMNIANRGFVLFGWITVAVLMIGLIISGGDYNLFYSYCGTIYTKINNIFGININ